MEKLSTILLVEDHHLSAKVVKNMLSELNCQVDIAMDAKTTLEMFGKKRYDLIFMDIGLPDMTGYEVTRRIRSSELNKNRVPIIALTAHNDSKNQQQCLDVTMNAVISKPLTRDTAQSILNTFIFERRKRLEYEPQPEEGHISEEKIVDFESAKKLLGGNEDVMRNMLSMLIDSLPHETKKLETAYQHQDWEIIRNTAHKLRGASSYCGTRGLQLACSKLDDYLGLGRTDQAHDLYQQVLAEIMVLRKFFAERKIIN